MSAITIIVSMNHVNMFVTGSHDPAAFSAAFGFSAAAFLGLLFLSIFWTVSFDKNIPASPWCSPNAIGHGCSLPLSTALLYLSATRHTPLATSCSTSLEDVSSSSETLSLKLCISAAWLLVLTSSIGCFTFIEFVIHSWTCWLPRCTISPYFPWR